jgi:hypothetical protein
MSDGSVVTSYYIGMGLISEQSSGIFGGGTGMGASVSLSTSSFPLSVIISPMLV